MLDPAEIAADGAVAIDWYEPSPDGSLVAIGLSEGGTEQSTLSVIDVVSGRPLADSIPNTRASTIAWLPDNSGFWYLRYPPESSMTGMFTSTVSAPTGLRIRLCSTTCRHRRRGRT